MVAISFERSIPIPTSVLAQSRDSMSDIKLITRQSIIFFDARRTDRTQCYASSTVACKHVVSAGSCCPTTDSASLWTGFCNAENHEKPLRIKRGGVYRLSRFMLISRYPPCTAGNDALRVCFATTESRDHHGERGNLARATFASEKFIILDGVEI